MTVPNTAFHKPKQALALAAVVGQVAMKLKPLAIKTGSHEAEENRGGAHPRHDLNSRGMCGLNHPSPGVSHTRNARVGNQPHIQTV